MREGTNILSSIDEGVSNFSGNGDPVKFENAWKTAETYLNEGFSVIPIADRAMIYKGREYYPKQPLIKWTQYQQTVISKEVLFSIMADALSNGIGIVCGKISGNLVAIDIDVKYQPGIDATLFQSLRLLYPDIFQKLRIVKTPSGGCHLIYRVVGGEVPGSRKLAIRHATPAELAKNPKDKAKAIIETRGEGGFIAAPPSAGYKILQDLEPPVLTWEEHCSLIALCESYNEIVKIEKPLKPTKAEESYYDENPFEHYNNTCDPVELMESCGWVKHAQNSSFIWFTRPGKDSSVSAAFNLTKRVFWNFTSSTELEPSKGYLPATLLAELQFNGDKKRTYAYLVENGYGKVKPEIEKRTAKLTALKGGKLPKNFSSSAFEDFNDEVSRLDQVYPYGIFWMKDEEGDVTISRERLYRVANSLGFRIYNGEIVQIDGYIVKKVKDRSFFDALKHYINEEDERQQETICNAYEAFIQRSGSFTISRIPELDTTLFITSTKTTCYKFFKNCYLQINKNCVNTLSYNDIGDQKIWEDEILQRNFKLIPFSECKKSLFYKFLQLATGLSDEGMHVLYCLGYLTNSYKDEEMGYIIVLTEQCDNPKNGGGSGKNIFSSLISHTISLKNIPGSQIQFNEKFLQAWNFEKVLSISDIPKRFDFLFLKELSTGTGIHKKLFKDEVTIQPSQMPKLIISTNYSYEVSDGGLKRRIIPIEFTDFFTRSGGVAEHFGYMFPYDWNDEEWLAYDNIIVEAIKLYLKHPKLTIPELTQTGWLKQFDQSYGQLTRLFIEENFSFWTKIRKIKIEDFNDQYIRYCNENQINPRYRISSQIMNRALEEYCKKMGYRFDPNYATRENGFSIKCKLFENDLL